VPDKPTCAKCGSDRVVTRVRIMDRGHYGADSGDLSAVVYAEPNAMMFKGAQRHDLSARVCGSCGFTELYLSDPHGFFETYQKQQS
jgi:hypothetical protein